MRLLRTLNRERGLAIDPDHPRPRRRRRHRRPGPRDVRGRDRRVGNPRADLLRPPAPLHLGPARLDDAARPARARERLAQIKGQPPSLLAPARGLPFPAPLPARVRAAARSSRTLESRGGEGRPSRPLLARRRSRSETRPHGDRIGDIGLEAALSEAATRRGAAARGHGPRQALPDQVGSALRPRRSGAVRAVDGVSLHRREGRDARARRRVRLRQVDARADDPPAARAHRRLGPLRGPGARRPRPPRAAAAAARDADDLPGPLRVAQPAQAGRPDRRRAAQAARRRRGRRAAQAGRGAARAGRASRPSTTTATRTSSRAASASGSGSPGRWRCSRS